MSHFYNLTNCGDIETRVTSNSFSTRRITTSSNETPIQHTTQTTVDVFTVEGVTLIFTDYRDRYNKTLTLYVDGNTVVVAGISDVDQAWTIFKNKDEEECGFQGLVQKGGMTGWGCLLLINNCREERRDGDFYY